MSYKACHSCGQIHQLSVRSTRLQAVSQYYPGSVEQAQIGHQNSSGSRFHIYVVLAGSALSGPGNRVTGLSQ